MRIWQIMLVATVLGCSAGMASVWYEVHDVVNYFEPISRNASVANKRNSQIKGPQAVVVGGPKFQFDTIAYDASAEHTFVIRNEGDAPLTLKLNSVSCGKCVETEFTEAVVAPGGTCEVVITYAARKAGTDFQESAYLATNDPLVSMLKLDIIGTVTRPVRLIPSDLALGTLSTSEGKSSKVELLGYRSKEMELLGHTFSNPATANFFEISTSPLTLEQVTASDKHATCGLLIRLTAKAGLPLGPLNQTITIETRSDGEHPVELTVTGEVVGDITVIGKGYSAERNMFGLGVIKRQVGRSETLYLLVKGPHRHDVKLSVGEVDPAGVLQVSLGEGVPIADGKAIKFPLTITVPKDSAPRHQLGDARGKTGKVVIETTHPTAKQIPIHVRFAIE